MTIAAGFRCNDGIVICADQEVTHEGAGKEKQKKIWSAQWDEVSAVLTGSNDWHHLNAAAEAILKTISACDSLDCAEDMARQTVHSIFSEYISLESQDSFGRRPSISLILALASHNECRMLRSDGLAIREANNVEFMGAGEVLASSYLGLLCGTSDASLLKASEVHRLATYILWRVKKSGYGCGGKTDLCVLSPNGEIEECHTRYLEKMFAQLPPILRRLVIAHSGASKVELENELASITDLLLAFYDSNNKYRNWIRPLVEDSDEDI
jgi:20S proteasome alpha/beta subunit